MGPDQKHTGHVFFSDWGNDGQTQITQYEVLSMNIFVDIKSHIFLEAVAISAYFKHMYHMQR